MMIAYWCLLIVSIFLISGLGFLAAPLWLWTFSFAITLIFFAIFFQISILLQTFLWLIVLASVVVLYKPLRYEYLSKKLFYFYKQILPSMSSTEREALEAGDVWWDAELFSGRPDWNKLLSSPEPRLTSEEQAFLDGPVEELCAMLDDWQITHEEQDLPEHVWQFIKDNKFFAMIIPKQYGGLEFSALAHSTVVMKVSTRCITAAVTIMVPNSLGPAMLLLEYGTKEQKDYYLPRLASGEELPCFALTAPEAGSDAGGMQDFGIICKGQHEGKEVLGIRLTWNKRYITLGPVATLLGLAFKLYDPDGLLGDEEELGITVALIPTSHPGVNIGRRHYPVNIPFQNGPNSGENVFIPMEWIIGGQDFVGQGWRMLMECLSDGRGISLPALSTGAGKFSCRTTGAYARVRQQFRVAIGEFEGVQEALARMAGLTYMMESARTLTLSALDSGKKPSVITAIIKYHLTESMRQIVNDAMDVHGGKGIMLGPKNYLARAYQALPVSITVEGANILTRNMIIFGQGAIRCHPFVLEEMQSVSHPDEQQGLEQFDKAIFSHIGFAISNTIRSFLLGITHARLSVSPVSNEMSSYYRHMTRMSSAFAILADVSMLVLGGSLKRKEKLSARLGDILSHLYLISSVLKHFQDQGCQKEDEELVHWNCQRSFYLIQEAMFDLLQNFPNRLIATPLALLLFPLGRRYNKPDDRLEARIAQILLQPGEARDRLSQEIYLPTSDEEVVYQLDDALNKVIEAGALEQKVAIAMKQKQLQSRNMMDAVGEAVTENIISQQESIILNEALEARRNVIQVDDFDPSELKGKQTQWQKQEKEPAIAQSI